ncbi:MAG TPA: PAS domain S-box protein, partial [Helicobacteraceae bacterium]|nr:PAS domain S-box protein [Helicobacteraceae bacterium]
MNLKSLFIILNIFNLASVVSVILIIIEYKQAYLAMENAYISKNKSFLLADELRQSSDDLTRLVRTYVITTEPRFKAQYYQILAIRNGLYPRPKNYNHIYWDFLSVEGSSDVNHPQEKAIALQELMVQAGFTKEELSLLTKSQHQSDELVRLEEKAMNAVNGMFEDDQGYYTIIKEPDLVLARELLHSNTYHEAKVKIMKPLDEFFKLLESRTDGIIHDAKEYVKQVEELLNLMVFVMIIVLTTSTGIMFHRILYPLISLKKSMLLLAKNDTSATIPEKSYNDEIGGMIEAIKVFKDNTERLIISEQKVKLLFDSVGEGFVGLNIRGNITFVNPVASQLLGYESQELWGKPFYRMFHAHTVVSKMSKLLLNDSAKKSKGVLEFKRQDDTVFPVEYTSTPILDPENNIEGAVIVFSDITKRKKHDDALKLAKETAEYANHSKTIFLANMSHELRTPLNAIIGFAQLILKDTNITTVQKENLKTIHKSGKHLLSIISEILEVAKLQAGKIEITNAAFDIHSFLDNIILVINNRAESKNLEFTYDNYTTIPRFLICDEQRLRQVLFNLLGNAIKFTQNGGIHLGITYENNHIAFAIKDTGTGIKEKDLQVIFKPFEQIKSSQQHHQGTGLGLAITQELVILMGGEIKVASSLGVGSQFSFSIA